MQFKQIELSDLNVLVKMYIETFNAGPWNDEWTVEAASRRLTQMIKCPDSYGLLAYVDNVPAGMILGAEEQYYNGLMFNIKEFCINNQLRGKGLGTSIYEEFEKRLKEKGIREIILLTSPGPQTEGFYHKRGFETSKGMIMMGKLIG